MIVNDTGIYYFYHGKDISFDTIEGRVIENFVYNTLACKYPEEIYFYRTKDKSEVDFVLKRDDVMLPVEVKFRSNIKISASFYRFMDRYNLDKGIIISKDYIGKRDNLFFIPVPMLPFCDII